MKLIKYHLAVPSGETTVEGSYCEIKCSDADCESNVALAQAEAYGGANGVTVEDIPNEPQELTADERITEVENALCEMDEAHAANLAAMEDALCEIEMNGGGAE